MGKNMPDLKDFLREKGCKITSHRLAILEVLQNSPALSAEDVFVKVREIHKAISLSTVYRNLEFLIGKGIVAKEGFLREKAKYRLNDNSHFHTLICLKCHKVKNIKGCPLKGYENKIGEKESFIVTGHTLEIYGYCQECAKTAGK